MCLNLIFSPSMTRVILACMARATVWRRWSFTYIEGVADYYHVVPLPSLAEGETLTRVRFHWQCQHVSEFPADAVGIPLGVGIILGAADAVTAPASPLTDPDADWLWWEAPLGTPYNVSYTSGEINEIDLWPPDQLERDVRSQRVAAAGGSTVWLVFEAPSEYSSQDVFYASASGSSLVLLPAT